MVRFIAFGGMTLDDIVFADGRVCFNVAGGNAVYSAIGVTVWSPGTVGIVSRIGKDYPEAMLTTLPSMAIDLTAVRRMDCASQHLWVLYEQDGRRQVIPRLDSGRAEDGLDPAPDQVPELSGKAPFALVSGMSVATQRAIAEALAARGIPFSLDNSPMTRPERAPEIATSTALRNCQLFLPSLEEIRMIWGRRPLVPLLESIVELGPRAIAVKMGGRGSLVFDAQHRELLYVPPVAVQVIDPTGAGDAYCGGFVAGYCDSSDAVEAACRGTVSASFVIQGVGALHAAAVDRSEALRRLKRLREQVRLAESSDWPA